MPGITVTDPPAAGTDPAPAATTPAAEETAAATGADAEEREIYLTPAGHYTVADIEANGRMTASHKFKGIRASHDMKPKSGDTLCPITMTKANPKFSWVVAGKTYEFCCPPCVDEFVTLAKSGGEIGDPQDYVKE